MKTTKNLQSVFVALIALLLMSASLAFTITGISVGNKGEEKPLVAAESNEFSLSRFANNRIWFDVLGDSYLAKNITHFAVYLNDANKYSIQYSAPINSKDLIALKRGKEASSLYFDLPRMIPDGKYTATVVLLDSEKNTYQSATTEVILAYTDNLTKQQKQEMLKTAAAYQSGGGTYKSDNWQVYPLAKGDVIYCALPGQTAFYTNKATVDSINDSYVKYYEMVQMYPHQVYGYRTQMGSYTVLKDMWVPYGFCRNNAVVTVEGKEIKTGSGGGEQYLIESYKDDVELIETKDLHE